MATPRTSVDPWYRQRLRQAGFRGRLLGDPDGPERFYWSERFGPRPSVPASVAARALALADESRKLAHDLRHQA